ncbi:iron-containing alcohol dehydrogenase [Pigmentiphaga soli]|uniref:Iron-containing alcohol dehydrogenase n=1 Tax=Pigmentiphaga soli TaxID=1007095 RepID=A0ABP8GKR9_9BURK
MISLPAGIASHFCPTRIFAGEGAYRALSGILAEHGVRRAFVVADGALLDGAFFRAVSAAIAAAGAEATVFSEIRPEPDVDIVHRAFGAQQACGATLTIAVGGGSTIDVAKAVGILAANGGRIEDYEGIEKFKLPPLPLAAIPATAGTGSEVSGSCVISSADGLRKMSIRHAALNPARYAILDPAALATAPAHVAVHAGVDAFVHAFESFISRQANPFTDALNLRAIELIAGNIRQLAAHRGNGAAALAMLCGSALAGMAFGQTGLGNVHCMARFLGARFHFSHGLSNALCLPYVACFNLAADPAKFARVAQAMGVDTAGMTLLEAARSAVEAIEDLCDDLGIPASLAQAGVDPAAFGEMADDCVRAGYERWNPRQTTRQDFLDLFRRAHEGTRLRAWRAASRRTT